MASNDSDEDDYLSEKFLVENVPSSSSRTTSQPKTYAQLRREAQRASEAKQAANRIKSVKQQREEALNTSLFERAKEDEEAGLGSSKALGMMAKMGFKPGQSLGKPKEVVKNEEDVGKGKEDTEHRAEPIPIAFWAGRKGLGLGKRAASSDESTRPTKSLKLANGAASSTAIVEDAEAYRARTRLEYEEKRAEGRLIPATRTCVSLDETKGGLKFNILWLNPRNPNSCPPELMEAFNRDPLPDISSSNPDEIAIPDDDDDDDAVVIRKPEDTKETTAARLRQQMKEDALQPLDDGHDEGTLLSSEGDQGVTTEADTLEFSPEEVEEAREFLTMPAKDRLAKVVAYLRGKYSYCFWCGTSYDGPEDLADSCPGEEEEAHD